MNKLIRKCFSEAFIAFSLIICVLYSHSSVAGGEHSGGGGFRELQFKSLGYSIIEVLKSSKDLPGALRDIDTKALKRAVDATIVQGTYDTLHPSPNGVLNMRRTTDAINIPSKGLIRFNIDAWDLIPTGSKRASLVLHEYLAILYSQRIPHTYDADYRISRLLREQAGLAMWFNSLELAQSMTENVPFDFLVQCSYTFNGGKSVKIDPIGSGKNYSSQMRSVNVTTDGFNVYINPKTKDFLQIYLYDESDEFIRGALGTGRPLRSSLRILVAETKTMGVIPKDPLIAQSLTISPNLKFDLELPKQKLKIQCHRMRNIHKSWPSPNQSMQ